MKSLQHSSSRDEMKPPTDAEKGGAGNREAPSALCGRPLLLAHAAPRPPADREPAG